MTEVRKHDSKSTKMNNSGATLANAADLQGTEMIYRQGPFSKVLIKSSVFYAQHLENVG